VTVNRRTPLAELPELLKPGEAASWLGCGKGTVYELVRRGDLRAVRLGRLLRIPRSGLEQLGGGAVNR